MRAIHSFVVRRCIAGVFNVQGVSPAIIESGAMRLWPLCHILQGATWSCVYSRRNEHAFAVRTSVVFSGRSCSSWGSCSSFQPKAVVHSLVVRWLVLCALQHCLVRCGSHQHLRVAIAHAAAHVLHMSNMLLG